MSPHQPPREPLAAGNPRDSEARVRVDIFHNILWSRYKGVIFSALDDIARDSLFEIRYFQIAATENERVGLGTPDPKIHRYPYVLLYPDAYERSSTVAKCIRLAGLVLRSDASLIVLPGYHRAEHWAMLGAARLRRKKTAVFCDSTAREARPSRLRAVAKRLFFRSCSGFFAYGTRSREYLLSLGAPDARIFAGCQAAALPASYDVSSVRARRRRAQAAVAERRILFVGRLSSEKGLESLIEVFARLAAIHADLALHLVGAGPQRDALAHSIAARNLAHRIHLRGALGAEALADEYLAATLFVLPSVREPWGLVVNEALSYGCRVVVSNVCGCVPELVADGVTGFSYEAGSIDALERALVAALACDESTSSDTTTACLNTMAAYTPARAAQRIFGGLQWIMLEAKTR